MGKRSRPNPKQDGRKSMKSYRTLPFFWKLRALSKDYRDDGGDVQAAEEDGRGHLCTRPSFQPQLGFGLQARFVAFCRGSGSLSLSLSLALCVSDSTCRSRSVTNHAIGQAMWATPSPQSSFLHSCPAPWMSCGL